MDSIRSNASSCTATSAGNDAKPPRCCSPPTSPGVFHVDGTVPTIDATRYSFQPADDSCTYDDFTRGQVVHLLESFHGAPLVIVGDSMMRQAFLRLVMLMRGQERTLDYKIQTHAMYHMCDEADAFRLSTQSDDMTKYDPDHLQERINPFFSMKEGPGLVAFKRSLERCRSPVSKIHYLMLPTFENQTTELPTYLDTLDINEGRKPVIIICVAFWEEEQELNATWADAILSLKNKASKIVLISTPIAYVIDKGKKAREQAASKAVFTHRNSDLQQWVQSLGDPYAFINYDDLDTARPPKPSPPQPGDVHWMCFVGWNVNKPIRVWIDDSVDGTDAAGNLLPQIVNGYVERIQPGIDGKCSEEMNRNLWKVIFDTILPTFDTSDTAATLAAAATVAEVGSNVSTSAAPDQQQINGSVPTLKYNKSLPTTPTSPDNVSVPSSSALAFHVHVLSLSLSFSLALVFIFLGIY